MCAEGKALHGVSLCHAAHSSCIQRQRIVLAQAGPFHRAIPVVLDSVGIGSMPDATHYNDEGRDSGPCPQGGDGKNEILFHVVSSSGKNSRAE